MSLDAHLLTLIVFLPLAGALLLLLVPSRSVVGVKWAGVFTSLLAFSLSVYLFVRFDGASAGMQFVERTPWIAALNADYALGVDGISLLLVVLTTFLTPLALIASWESIRERVKGFVFSMLLLETGILGVFLSLDMFLFYVFWESMLVPMYFVIGVWGGKDRIYAAVKFFLYTMAGSVLMLVAIIWLGVYAMQHSPAHKFTTDLLELYTIAPGIPFAVQTWMFLAFGVSFAVKVPVFPFHTWLPDAHVQAPTAGSVILAGVLLKMGTYGIVRFCLPLFPQATFHFLPWAALLAVVGIIYGALVSMVQTDVKKLVAYSSVSHLGFVVLGIFALTEEGLQGGILQMVNHGLSTGALFLLVGMIYDRRHTREISDFGGLARQMPVYAAFMMIVVLSSLGLPGLNGFVGEFMILLGSFKSPALGNIWFAVFAATGVILAAVYLLWMYQRVFFGKLENPANQSLKDLNAREVGVLLATVVFIVWIGVYPSTFLEKSGATSKSLIQFMTNARTGSVPGLAWTPAERRGAPDSGGEALK
ncbi:MAG: NADH-quinone oxidoreductase subunit M [Ignavibacteriales bacterium CG07_land_8_20_14_0_80_59_12]|nr:MAG: NADH-quinone oxidoreductase subunit M [Ignavibacteriales bacterium CG07_land_8_20_14_0_80_59_12]